MKLEKQVAIVTGGASGIGRCAAIGLAREGATVVVMDTNFSGAAETVKMIEEMDRVAIPVRADTTNKNQLEEMVKKINSKYRRIDILVTSAGILEESGIEETTQEQWNEVIGVNLTGVLYSIQAVLPVMQTRKYGKIVILSSIAAFRGRAKQSAYCTAAGALTALAANTAVQVGKDGINVNCIAPGIIDTTFAESLKDDPEYLKFRIEHTPLRRRGKPEDLVGPILFFASQDSDFITGETLIADGGVSIYTNGYGL